MIPYISQAICQGLTELLPISSSAHLYLLSYFQKTPHMIQNLDVVLHLGSLAAIITYFHARLWFLVCDSFKGICRFQMTKGLAQSLMIIIAVLPTLAAGYLIKKNFHIPQTLFIIGLSFIVFGILAVLAEFLGPRDPSKVNFKKIMWIGLVQIFAFIPGASRLGVSTTIARFLGVERWKATQLSFILSIPILSGAVFLELCDAFNANEVHKILELWPTIALTFTVSLIFLPLLKIFLNYFSFMPFGFYRIFFGIGLVYLSLIK